jgi:hypothetical protein
MLRLVLTLSTGNVLVEGADYPKKWSSLVLVWMITYVASYATGCVFFPFLPLYRRRL